MSCRSLLEEDRAKKDVVTCDSLTVWLAAFDRTFTRSRSIETRPVLNWIHVTLTWYRVSWRWPKSVCFLNKAKVEQSVNLFSFLYYIYIFNEHPRYFAFISSRASKIMPAWRINFVNSSVLCERLARKFLSDGEYHSCSAWRSRHTMGFIYFVLYTSYKNTWLGDLMTHFLISYH